MEQTAVEFLELMFLRILSFDSEEHRKKYKDVIRQAKEMEKQQQGYTEEEVLNIIDNFCETFKVDLILREDFNQWFEQFKSK